jgi:hypothetical protein
MHEYQLVGLLPAGRTIGKRRTAYFSVRDGANLGENLRGCRNNGRPGGAGELRSLN